MKKWFKQLGLTKGLQLSFLLSASLCLFVGGFGIYSLEKQKNEIHSGIDQGFPKVQAAFQIEEQINHLNQSVSEFINAENFNNKLNHFAASQAQLQNLKYKIVELYDDNDNVLLNIINAQDILLDEIEAYVQQRLSLNETFNRQQAKLEWLHDDFKEELTALLQELNWQLSTLFKRLTASQTNVSIEHLETIQRELSIIYDISRHEESLVSELLAQILNKSNYSLEVLPNYLNYLDATLKARLADLTNNPSNYTIKQIINETLNLGINKSQLFAALQEREELNRQKTALIRRNNDYLDKLRENIKTQVSNSQKQLGLIQNIIDKSNNVSRTVILIVMMFSCLLVIGVNVFYIRLRLLNRLQILNQSVDQLINGKRNVTIPIYGNDELAKIATLLKLFIFEVNNKNNELIRRNQALFNEIQERKQIQEELLTTQTELIQTAKLAVVGQTLTSISHEVNQPLNAINAYIFSAKRAVAKQDYANTLDYLEKIEKLIERASLIIKRLRNFSKQGSANLVAISLSECAENAWSLLESKHKPRQAKLIFPENLPRVSGESILIEQVFVNLFLNALEAIPDKVPEIQVEVLTCDRQKLILQVIDNGDGWPLNQKLLQPFSSSKSLNLGLGLSISASIMKQCDGNLSVASALNKNAIVLLEFKVVQHDE